MTLRPLAFAIVLLATTAAVTYAQQPAAHPGDKGHDNRSHDQHGPDDYHIMPEGMPNIWWHIPGMAQKIGLSADQQKRMDDTLGQNRDQLFQLSRELHKQRDLLQPMLDANPPETAKILPQLDRVAQARSALEVARDKVLLNIRTMLTPDQWNRLQAENRNWQAAHPNTDQDDHHNRDHAPAKPISTTPSTPSR